MRRSVAFIAFAALTACSNPADVPAEADRQPVPRAEADDPLSRARAAGLADDQARALLALHAPVLLPRAMPGWTVTQFEAATPFPGVKDYTVSWRRDDGACLDLMGSNDGLGGPGYPGASVEVTLASLPGSPSARVYKADTDPLSASAESWGAGNVVSDYVEVGENADFMAVWLLSRTGEGCASLSLRDAAAILASLRPLERQTDG